MKRQSRRGLISRNVSKGKDGNFVHHWPPRRSLVALDPSPASEIAWKQAEIVSRVWKAERHAIYVQPWIQALTEYGDVDPDLTAKTSQQIVSGLRRRLNISEKVLILPGDTVDGIAHWAATDHFDLIVVGAQVRSGLARAFHSSVAEAVVRRSSIPVLVAKNTAREVRSVLAPYDFKAESGMGLRIAAACAKSLGSQLTIFHVAATPGVNISEEVSNLKQIALDAVSVLPASLRPDHAEVEIAWGKAVPEILEASRRFDLVVLTARSRGFFEDSIIGTTAERVIRYSAASVLTVPAVMRDLEEK